MRRSFLILLLCSLSSCSLFIENYEKDIFEEHDIFPKKESIDGQCREQPKISLISENKFSQASFEKLLRELSKKYELNFIDKVILWSLVQMNTRPDLSSPTSKLQFLISYKGKQRYFNSYSEDTHLFPYLKVLDQLAREYKSTLGLKNLAKILDENFKHKPIITKAFESFLIEKKDFILSQPYLKKIYIRGDETLKENERIPSLNFSSIVNMYNKNQEDNLYKIGQFLFTYKQTDKNQLLCNFDMSLYKKALFLISDKKVQSHIFGIHEGQHTFMAESSQDNSLNAFINNTFLFKGASNIRSASLCSFESVSSVEPNKNERLWLFSSESRDPGQHLFHLLQYDVHDIKTSKELTSMLNFSRHLFLKNPIRLIIESRRSSHAQLNELLKLNIPIYNAKKLGKIWGFYSNTKRSDFILDERQQGHINCK